MKPFSSRRDFLVAGIAASAVPVAGSAPPSAEPQSPKPVFRAFGKTGFQVSTLGFGCMTTSDATVIERACDIGINYFDTARIYQNGNNERMVGAALKGKRQKIFLSSKTWSDKKQVALADLDTSLRELGTDYLDIWYLHGKSRPEDVTDDLLEAQEIAKKAGKIRFRGVSTHFNMPEMLAHLVKRGQTDVALIAYNFTMKPNFDPAIAAAREAGMGIVAMKVMAGGLSRIKVGDRLYGASPEALTRTLKQDGAMVAALKWALKNKSVDTSIVCMTDFEQLDENFRAMSQPFGGNEEKLLSAQLEYIRPLYCRMCGACGGTCDRGLPVADTLRFLAYAEGYGQFAMARQSFLDLPESVRQIRCADCESCSVNCPNGVEVRNRLTRAQTLFA